MKKTSFYICAVLAVLLIPLTLHLIFYETPIERNFVLLFNQKIFYYHVACAFMLFLAVFICGVASIFYLKKREAKFDAVAQAAGELAVFFGAIVLLSGAIWGSAAWGKPWTWEARLTTSLLLWMLMVGYLIVRRYGGASEERLAAGLAVFAMIDVPLIYISVNIWNRLHPKTSVVSNLGPQMKQTFWLCVFLWFVVFLTFFLFRTAQAKAMRRIRDLREHCLDEGLFE